MDCVTSLDCLSVEFETPCLICGEGIAVGLTDRTPKICEHCKLAILEMRRQLNATCGNCKQWQRDDKADIYWCPIVKDRIEMHNTPCHFWQTNKKEN